MNRLLTLTLLFFVALTFTSCDLIEDDNDLGRLAGGWSIQELYIDGESYTNTLFSYYDRISISFFLDDYEQERFLIIGHPDYPYGLEIEGDVDIDGRSLELWRDGSNYKVEFDHSVQNGRLVLVTDDDDARRFVGYVLPDISLDYERSIRVELVKE